MTDIINAVRQIGAKFWEHILAGILAAWEWCVSMIDAALAPVASLIPVGTGAWIADRIGDLGCWWWMLAGDVFVTAMGTSMSMFIFALVLAWVRMRFVGGL